MKDKNPEKRYEYDFKIMDKERAIEEELNEGRTSFSETEQKRKYIENLLVQQQEEVASQYRKVHRLMEDEREQLQKERNQLSWD